MEPAYPSVLCFAAVWMIVIVGLPCGCIASGETRMRAFGLAVQDGKNMNTSNTTLYALVDFYVPSSCDDVDPRTAPIIDSRQVCMLSPPILGPCSAGAAEYDYRSLYLSCRATNLYDFDMYVLDLSAVADGALPYDGTAVCVATKVRSWSGPSAQQVIEPTAVVWSHCDQELYIAASQPRTKPTTMVIYNRSSEQTTLFDLWDSVGTVGTAEPPGSDCGSTLFDVVWIGPDNGVFTVGEINSEKRMVGEPTDISFTSEEAYSGSLCVDHVNCRKLWAAPAANATDHWTKVYVIPGGSSSPKLCATVQPHRLEGVVLNTTAPSKSCKPKSYLAIEIAVPVSVGAALIIGGTVAAIIIYKKLYTASLDELFSFEEPEASVELVELSPTTQFDKAVAPLLKSCSPVPPADFCLKVSTFKIDFGLGTRQAAVGTQLDNSISIFNPTRSKIQYQLLIPTSHKYTCKFEPEQDVLLGHTETTIDVKFTVLCTTIIDTDIILMATIKEKKEYIPIKVALESRLSTSLDYNELMLEEPPIGEGSYGIVYKAAWRGQEVAVKIVKNQESGNKFQEFHNEVQTLEALKCPQIVTFIGAVRSPGHLAIVTEFFPLGNLRVCMKNHKFSTKLKIKCILDCARGMAFLHSSHIIHRDLKTDNLLVYSLDRTEVVNCKITDFGTTRGVTQATSQTFTSGVGTPVFSAPEMLEGGHYTQSADLFSFAVVCYQVMSGKEPYSDFDSLWKVTAFVLSGKRLSLSRIKEPIANLIENCWAHDPSARPSFEQVVETLEKKH
ncbi:tyrosine protein kinase [Pelomyxa schiedti]|nr:tyrosine protein kinase [Pelomyxa schiedti]